MDIEWWLDNQTTRNTIAKGLAAEDYVCSWKAGKIVLVGIGVQDRGGYWLANIPRGQATPENIETLKQLVRIRYDIPTGD